MRPPKSMPGDAELLAAARAGIERLNRRHPDDSGIDRFFLLHRSRGWNEVQRQWIGWERKRGKLHELNHLLRGSTGTTFLDATARPLPADVRYVVTLDSDTRLPRDAVVRLVGKMAHPLNRPRIDAALGRVVEGYGVLQPRVTPSLPVGTEGSLFQRIFSSNSGIDPYAGAVSDVYQDLYGEGSYSGKGIYDVDAFETALQGRVPDSTMLSHDLFEGIFARAGLASDIEVVEEFPARYDVAAARQHRWARGDWQLLPWMLGLVRAGAARERSDYLTAIGFWKMFDNLRRTLLAPAVLLSPARGMDPALPRRAGLDDLPGADRRHADDPAGRRRRAAAARRDHPAQPFRRAVDGHRRGERPGGAARRLSRPSRLADGRCDRPDPVPPSSSIAACWSGSPPPSPSTAAAPAGSASTARWPAASSSPCWPPSSWRSPVRPRCRSRRRSCWRGWWRHRSPCG